MRKSVSKRIRITRTGKIMRRPMAVDHFRTRRSQKRIRNSRKTLSLGHSIRTILNLHH